MFYLTKNGLPFFIPIGFIGIYRWFWFMVRVCAYWLYKPIQPPQEKARYQACKDVTILVPTIDAASDGIRRALASWLVSDPFQIIFITIESAKSPLQALAREFDATGTKIRVITVKKPNKRRQMVYGVNHTRTPIVIFADDDVIWPPEMIRWILAPFEEKQMGGVGKH